ncbi:hypothetical protein PRK78_003761 [Emydomyces testavorans]|uniref:Uncharacterized protein n=1 Tax=Emydomyces testavorans TaxID=2070801 RepID=A0AAF0DHD5_9EURO|nr:hypothetical protein PRK78_003761 [Emydomyces testavorans]
MHKYKVRYLYLKTDYMKQSNAILFPQEVYCHICRFAQDIKYETTSQWRCLEAASNTTQSLLRNRYRPDVQSQHAQGGQGPPPVASGAQPGLGPGQPPPEGHYGYK